MVFHVLRPLSPFILVAAIIFFVGSIILYPSLERNPLVAEEKEDVTIAEEIVAEPHRLYSAREVSGPTKLREALIRERGGRILLSSISSLRLTGRMDGKNGERSISILMMKPDLVLVKVFGEGEQLALGYDGKEFWKNLRREDVVVEALAINPVEQNLLGALGGIHGPLLREFLDGQERVDSVEDVSTTTGRILRVTFNPLGRPGREVVDLDPVDLGLLRWEYVDPNGIVLEMKYKDHRDVGGLSIAHRVEFWLDGQRELTLFYDEIDLNFGAVKYLFRNPNQ